MEIILFGIIVWVALALAIVVALCRAAADGDEGIEE